MYFGLNVINAWPADFILELAILADKAGWDGFFLWDHLTFEFDISLHDPWVLLGAIAGCTQNLRIGPIVTALARRRAHKVAKEAVTLDHLSKGRAVLGVGLGGIDREFSAFGEESKKTVRAEKLDEALHIINRLWSGETVEHHGKHYTIDKVAFLPKPIQEPRIPIWVGGHSKSAIRRASQYDGWCPAGPTPSVGERGLSLKEIQEANALIKKNRKEDRPIDIVYTLELSEPGKLAEDRLEQFSSSGITWLLEAIQGMRYSQTEAKERVKMGPPCIQ
jgi:alkanesulfonate monooxygenase SsuD/methylene tetrahydromethanopterin reductase-like flavin-dependent oxidoreductase (luciferase family)